MDAWIHRMLGVGVEEVVVVTGEDGPMIRESTPAVPGLRWAVNPEAGRSGPRESLLLGADAAASGHAALFSPVDVPVPSSATLSALIDAWSADAGAFAVVPTCHGRPGHPVLASPRMIRRLFEGEPGDRVDSLLAWARQRVLHVSVEDERTLRDLDCPEDYLMALERGEHLEWSGEPTL